MEAEEYFTEERLAEFAVNYKKYPVLWCSWHPKYADPADRSRAYRRLAVAQAVPRGGAGGVTRRMERLCQYFHRRVKQEVARLAAGEARGAAPQAPPWAVAAERYLCLKPFARQPAPARRLVRLLRGMRSGARAGAGLGPRAAAALAPSLGLPPPRAAKLWRELRDEALAAVHRHILRGDVPGEAAPSALHWAVADLSVLYGGDVTADEHYQKVETLQALLGTFHLVQQYMLEPAARGSAAAWARAARLYSRKGAAASALLLQRRWFELRESTRRRLAPDAPPGLRALPLHRAVADRYPAVVSGPALSWEQLRREGRLARPTSATGPAPGETFCLGSEDVESEDSVSDIEEANDDVILIEREIETIDVDGDDSADEGPPRAAAQSLPDLDDCELPDTPDQHEPEHAVDTRDQPTTVSKYLNKAKAPVGETVGVKQVEKTVAVANELQDNENNQDTGATAVVETGTEKTIAVNERTDTTVSDCAQTIANIINQTAACSKTNITDSGSKNINAAVNTSNKVHDNFEEAKKDSTVIKYGDKTIDNSKEIVDLDKTIDHNLLEALQELDADFIETMILFESDEDDVTVKSDPNDKKISDKGVTKKFNECLETSSRVNEVEKESKIGHKVSRLSGPKSKTAPLRNRITFESDEEGAHDASDNDQLDGVDEASDSRVSNEDQDVKSAVNTKNTENTKSSEINLICSENLDSDNEYRSSVNSRKRRLSESSEDEGLLVIADAADDVNDNSKDQTEVDNENEQVDVCGVSDEDAATKGSPSVVQYPLLVELLKSKSDDLKRYKRFEEIKRRVKAEAKKLLKQRCEEVELDAIATKVVRESLAQTNSRIHEYARNIVTELNEGSGSDDEPDQFDEKLLMIPVVELTRIPLPWGSAQPLGRSFLSLARNRRLLARCRPCAVRLLRADRGPARVAKRVRLPDIDAVRALNRTIATAQVAPISARAAPQATEGADAEASPGAAAIPSVVRSCQHNDSEYVYECGACAAAALARPPPSRAAAHLQRRALRRTARLAQQQQVLADKQQSKKRRKEEEHLPAPAHPPRARSPYDEQRALREWLREKSVVAEKFGIKPRSYKKVPAHGPPAAPPGAPSLRSIVTMNKAGELTLNPPLLLNNCSQPTQTVAAHYVLDNEGAVLSAVSRPQPDHLKLVPVSDSAPAREGLGADKGVQSDDAGPRQYRTAFTLNPGSQGYTPNKSTTQIVVTQTSSGQTAAKMTPKFFNLNCVANINKTLNTLATHEPPPPAPEEGEALLPIITRVESLAGTDRASPPRPLTMSGQTTITPIPRSTSQNIAQQGTNGNNQGNVSFANSSQGDAMPAGGFLTALGGYIIQRPQSETRAQPSVIRTQNVCATSSASQPALQYNTATVGAPRPDGSRVVLISSQPPPRAQALQVNSVQAGPPHTHSLLLAPQSAGRGQLTMTLVNQPPPKPTALQVTAVHAGLPKVTSVPDPRNPLPSVSKTKQTSVLPSEERTVAQLNTNLQAAQSSSGRAAPSQTDAVLNSARSARNDPNETTLSRPDGPPGAAPSPPPPVALLDGSRKLLFQKLEPELPDVPARTWAAGRDPTALSVLAAGAGAAWRVADHLVLAEAAAPRAADRYYSLAPLQRLILPEEEDKIKQDVKKLKDKKTEQSDKPDKEKEQNVSWLKVKSFAKMGNDGARGGDGAGGGRGEDTDSAEEVELTLRAPPRVYLENKVYAKMRDTPLVYAKVLHDVSGPAACRALLLRRAPVLLYSLRDHALTPVYGEPAADGSSLTLTAARDLFGALHELATYLAPPGGPAPVRRRRAPPDPPPSAHPAVPPAPDPAPAPTETPGPPCEPSATDRYGNLLKYIAYTPDSMVSSSRKLFKHKSKSQGDIERGERLASPGSARGAGWSLREAGGSAREAGGSAREAGGSPRGAGGSARGARGSARRAGGVVRIAPRPAQEPPVIDLGSSGED